MGHDTETRGYYRDKDELITRLRRIEGQVRGLQRLIEEDQYCIDILTQVSAVTSGLKRVAIRLLDEHIQHCVADSVATGGDPAARINEATAAIARLLKS